MKKKLFLFILLFVLVCPRLVMADHIYDIKMDIYLEKNGSANITETWDVKADSGSEWYKQLYNMGNQELSNFKVSMDGRELEYKTWYIDEGIEEKSGYYGINYVSEGLELCFGKTDMNRHKFTLNYTLSNFVFNVSDAQVVYQTLFPNATLDSFKVTVSSYYEFSDTLDVWGFGGQFLAYVNNGKIELDSDTYSLYNDYVVLLAKFPLGTFETDNTSVIYNTFDEVLETAKDGTYEYDYGYKDNRSGFEKFIDKFFSILGYLVPVAFIFGVAKAVSNSGYGYKDNKTIDKKNTPMFRDIPCNKDIYYANALISMNEFGYNETNIFGAIILKWLREDKISFINQTKGIFNKETSAIDLRRNPTFDNQMEVDLFDIMYKASGDGILETKELEKWCKRNYDKFFKVFKSITSEEISKLEHEGHVYKRQSKEECKKKNVMDDKIYNDSKELFGLKLFLKEFSDMKNKEAIEVKLWDEYLMFAYLFGMADKVAKQFKNLYPEVVREMEARNMDYATFMYINHLSTSTVHAASAARSAAESYSSGGGGFSSGGGGGGSFGGGGSMGGR